MSKMFKSRIVKFSTVNILVFHKYWMIYIYPEHCIKLVLYK